MGCLHAVPEGGVLLLILPFSGPAFHPAGVDRKFSRKTAVSTLLVAHSSLKAGKTGNKTEI